MIIFKDLPPLPSLVFFEATARLGSFSQAANELCVTQSAVSKQIRSLEGNLGCQLFYRDAHAIRLTHEGYEYYQKISKSLKNIATVSAQIRNCNSEITIISTIAVAHYWLFPRVAAFNAEHPDIKITIYASDDINANSCQNYDLGILYGNGNWSDKLHSHVLFRERIYAVCGMQYPIGDVSKITPQDLVNEKLLHLDPLKWRWNNWKSWFGYFDIEYNTPSNALVMNNFPLLLQAASANLGISLGWEFAVEDLIKNKIVRKATSYFFESADSDYLVYSSQRDPSKAAMIFKAWLLKDG